MEHIKQLGLKVVKFFHVVADTFNGLVAKPFTLAKLIVAAVLVFDLLTKGGLGVITWAVGVSTAFINALTEASVKSGFAIPIILVILAFWHISVRSKNKD